MTAQEYVGSLFDLTGHVGIITGASRGLGFGQAKVLTDAGATVYNLDLVPHDAEEGLREECLKSVICDVTDYEKAKQIIDEIAAREGHLDFLINNAGITFKSRAEEFPVERLDKILEINLKTPYMMARLCYPYLKQSAYVGRVVTISSMAAYMGFTGVLPYDMTKAGVLGLTRGLAEEWKNDNILVNSVAPGWFLTKLNEEMFAQNPDRKKAALEKPMLPRFGQPEEIGYMMLFLLSGASKYLTGRDFPVDGGATVHGF
ncbi:MAG: SDR family oxidoreductase [Lachnospiraceae bacterium]|jgi:2-deoxy-D-gluconate 3-dehydrogenase|nr:SDR family oxidoreductase [Lachnospiraceae bacterium]